VHPKLETQPEKIELIQLLCTQINSIKEATLFLNITEDEVKKKLRDEFLELRKKTGLQSGSLVM
jgi:hypothetical protein